MKFITLSDGRIMNMDLAEEILINVLNEKQTVFLKQVSDKNFNVPMLELSAEFVSGEQRIIFHRITFTMLVQQLAKWSIRMPSNKYDEVCKSPLLTEHDLECIKKAYELFQK